MFLLPVPYCASTQAAGGLIVKDFFIGEVAPGLEVGDRKVFAMQNLSSVRLIDFEDSCVVHAKSLLLCPNILFAYGHCLRILATGFEASTKMNSCLESRWYICRGIKEAIVHSSNPVQVEDAPSWKNPQYP